MRTSVIRQRVLAGSLAAFGLSISLPVLAAPTASELAEQARAAMASGDVARACALLEERLAAVRASGEGSADDALFDLADCHEKAGNRAAATSEYERVAASPSPRAAEAKQHLEKLGVREPIPLPPVPPPAPLAVPPPAPTPVVTLPSVESPTRVGDFMDTRLSWTFGDDDVLHSTGQAYPLSPSFNIGDRKQYRLFFDNLNSRFGGRENLTHLALYKKMPGFIRRLDTEAAAVLRFDLAELASNNNNLNKAIYDAGSYIRAFYHTGDDPNSKSGIGVTFWPIDTDRFRLGYLYDLSWGGTAVNINQSIFPRIQGSAPGAKVQYDAETWSAYIGFKTASIVQVQETLTPGTSEVEQIRVSETNLGVLGGASADFTDNIHLDVGGGFFQQGKFDLPDVAGKPVYTAGVSGRFIVHHKDMRVPQSIDFLLYRNDPNRPQIMFKPEEYVEGKTTWLVSAEYNELFQNLKAYETTGATKIQEARAAALQANFKSSFLRGSVTGIYRAPPYVLRNQPSFIPFETLPTSAKTSNELFFAVAADYYLPSLRLTPGIGGGVQFPATFESTTTDTSSAPIHRTVLVREQGNLAILPVGKTAVPIVQARVSLRWDISPMLSAIGWAQYIRDNNGTFVERDPSEGTVMLRAFVSPDFLGMGTSVQARF